MNPNTKLTIELVPRSCWYSNVRSEVTPLQWDRIKKIINSAAGYRCEICGGVGAKWPVEVHEVWHYDDENLVQKLMRMISLCPACHEVKHIGLAQTKGRLSQALAHLMEVNGWDAETARRYVTESFDVWQRRSEYRWTLDISYLSKLSL